MRQAGLGPMGTGKDVETPWMHEWKDNEWNPVWGDNPVSYAPAGGVHCSALELANYAYARVLGAYRKGEYLSPQTWRTLQEPPPNSGYACGICVSGPDARGIRDMSHGGSNVISFADWWVRDSGRWVVVAMVNCSPYHFQPQLDPYTPMVELAERYYGIR